MNVKLCSPIEKVWVSDIAMADRQLLRPTNSNPLVEGEWLEYNTSYKGIRAGGLLPCWMVFMEKGRSDVQAIGKAPVLYLGAYEAETAVYTSSGLANGDKLMVDDVTFESLTRSGLKKHGGGSELVIGFVTRLMTGKVRFIYTLC